MPSAPDFLSRAPICFCASVFCLAFRGFFGAFNGILQTPKATEGERETCVFLLFSVLKLLLLPLLSLRHKAEICTDSWLPCAKGAGAERLRDCLESTKSVKIHSRLCGTNPLPAEPQHPSVAYGDSSPLEKRAAYRCLTAV